MSLLVTPYSFPSMRGAASAKVASPTTSWRDRYDPTPSPDLGLIPRPQGKGDARPYYDEAADGQARKAYYENFQLSSDGAAAYKQLHELVMNTHHTQLPYEPEKYLYPWVDLRPNGQIESIYSPLSLLQAPSEAKQKAIDAAVSRMAATAALAPETAAAAMNLTEAFGSLNCEHVVPQSWYDGKEPMRGDLHHLFACDSRCNSFRGNRAYREAQDGECGEACSIDNKVEHCGVRVDGDQGFIPQGGKGPAARATLYFILRYPKKAKAYRPEDLQTLLKWHKEEPPTLYERHRNAAIEELQGNRNPLIDHPEWAEKIDFTQGLLKHPKAP